MSPEIHDHIKMMFHNLENVFGGFKDDSKPFVKMEIHQIQSECKKVLQLLEE